VIASGGILQREHELPDATIAVFQGIAFLTVLASEALRGRLSSVIQSAMSARKREVVHARS
jgi:ABC-type uncharacterized transport system permease subunit